MSNGPYNKWREGRTHGCKATYDAGCRCGMCVTEKKLAWQRYKRRKQGLDFEPYTDADAIDDLLSVLHPMAGL